MHSVRIMIVIYAAVIETNNYSIFNLNGAIICSKTFTGVSLEKDKYLYTHITYKQLVGYC